jgi:hypothetical protein
MDPYYPMNWNNVNNLILNIARRVLCRYLRQEALGAFLLY